MFSSLVVVGFIGDLWTFNEKKLWYELFWSFPVISNCWAWDRCDMAWILSQIDWCDTNSSYELAAPVTKLNVLAHLQNQEKRMAATVQCPVKEKSSEKMRQSIIFRQPERLYDGYLQWFRSLQLRSKQSLRTRISDNKQLVKARTHQLVNYPPYNQKSSTLSRSFRSVG